MALPTSGPLSFSAIATEAGDSGSHYFGESVFRALINKPSGPVSFSNFRGASLSALSGTGTTLHSAGAGSANLLIERIGAPTNAIKVTMTINGANAVWNFNTDGGYGTYSSALTSANAGNAAYALTQAFYGHSASGYGWVNYDGTNVMISIDFGTYSFASPPNIYGNFLSNQGLGVGCPPDGSNSQTGTVAQGRRDAAQMLNPLYTESYPIRNGYPGIVTKFYPATRIA